MQPLPPPDPRADVGVEVEAIPDGGDAGAGQVPFRVEEAGSNRKKKRARPLMPDPPPRVCRKERWTLEDRVPATKGRVAARDSIFQGSHESNVLVSQDPHGLMDICRTQGWNLVYK